MERGTRGDGRGGPFLDSIGHCAEARHHMANIVYPRAHLVAGGFPPGSSAGHDHDYARLRLLTLLDERQIPASVANDFVDVEKWLPVSRLLVTYVAGPYPVAEQCARLKSWLESGAIGWHCTAPAAGVPSASKAWRSAAPCG